MVNLEADESDGSFLKLPINYSIVTNIDLEHMDYYKNFKNLKSFTRFINKTPPIGKSLVCIDDKNIKKIVKKVKNKNILFMVLIKRQIIELATPDTILITLCLILILRIRKIKR